MAEENGLFDVYRKASYLFVTYCWTVAYNENPTSVNWQAKKPDGSSRERNGVFLT